MSERRSDKHDSRQKHSDRKDQEKHHESPGRSGDEVLIGGARNDQINGGHGNDVIHGNGGHDKLDGGAGDDTLIGGADNDWLKGDSGDDVLAGEGGNDKLDGGSGSDVIDGGVGWDALEGGSGDDQLSGGAGNDYLDGGSGFDTAVFSGSLSDYRFLGDRDGRHDDWLIVRDARDGSPDGTDFLRKVEALQFSDAIIYLDGRNNVPVAGADQVSALEDQPLTVAASALLANDADFEGDTLSVTGVGGAVNGTVVLDGGNVIFTPAANFSGEASFTYTVSDGRGGTAQGIVRVDVGPVNDAPIARADAYAAGEDDVLHVAAPGVLANDSDIDGDSLEITSTAPILSAFGATVVLNEDGSFSYDPTGASALQALDDGESVDDTFTYTVSDGEGGIATQTVTVHVAGANDGGNHAPRAVDDSFATDEDTHVNGNVLANDSDAENDAIVVTGVSAAQIVGGPLLPAGVLTVQPDGQFEFAPDASALLQGLAVGESVDVAFDYTISDGTLTDTGTATVHVTGVNDAPQATASIELSALEDAPDLQLLLGGDDIDSDDDGSTLTYTIVGQPDLGSVALVGTGPGAVFSGLSDFDELAQGATRNVTFTYQATDSHGAVSNVGTVTITVTGINDAPEAVDDAVSTDEDVPLVLSAASLLENDLDVDAGDPSTVVSVQDAVNGTVILEDGQITFRPGAEYSGPASFAYTMQDSAGAQSTATVHINVDAVNDAPAALFDLYATGEDDAIVVDASQGVLANDSDVEGDPFFLVNAGPLVSALGASVVLNLDGSFSYDPTGSAFLQALDSGESTPDAFTYFVADIHGAVSAGFAFVVISGSDDGANNPPLAADDSFAVAGTVPDDLEPTLHAGNVLINDVDPDGDLLTVVPQIPDDGVTLYATAYGTLRLDATGELDLLVGTEPDGLGGPSQADLIRVLPLGLDVEITADVDGNPLAYLATDGHDAGSAAFTVTILGQNDAPVVQQEVLVSIDQDSPLILEDFIDTYAFDWDPDDLGMLRLTELGALDGSVSYDESTDTVTYTPTAGFTGEDTIFYGVTDSHDATSVGVFIVTVNPLDGLESLPLV